MIRSVSLNYFVIILAPLPFFISKPTTQNRSSQLTLCVNLPWIMKVIISISLWGWVPEVFFRNPPWFPFCWSSRPTKKFILKMVLKTSPSLICRSVSWQRWGQELGTGSHLGSHYLHWDEDTEATFGLHQVIIHHAKEAKLPRAAVILREVEMKTWLQPVLVPQPAMLWRNNVQKVTNLVKSKHHFLSTWHHISKFKSRKQAKTRQLGREESLKCTRATSRKCRCMLFARHCRI